MSDHKPTPPPTNKTLTPPPTSKSTTPPTTTPIAPPPSSKPTTPTLSRRNSLRPAGDHLTPQPSNKPTTLTLSRRNSFRPPGGQLPTFPTTTSTWRPPRPRTPLPTPSTSTSAGSRSPIETRPPLTLSICVHTSLTHLSNHRNTPIRPGTRYRCCCSTHTLRKAVSQSSFRYIDGAGGQTVYAAAPAKALWCYCSGGEGHIVGSAGEAVERYLALGRERSREGREKGDGEVGGNGNGEGNGNGSERVERLSEGQQRVSEVQQRELETVEWGGTEEALRKQRDFVWFGEKVGRCCRWFGCPWLCKRGERAGA